MHTGLGWFLDLAGVKGHTGQGTYPPIITSCSYVPISEAWARKATEATKPALTQNLGHAYR